MTVRVTVPEAIGSEIGLFDEVESEVMEEEESSTPEEEAEEDSGNSEIIELTSDVPGEVSEVCVTEENEGIDVLVESDELGRVVLD